MPRTLKTTLSLALIACLIAPPGASAWGERGHDTITRVAVRLLASRIATGTPLASQFGRKEYMLGHLANIPDILWRNQGPDLEKLNAPTHFLDLEPLSPELSFKTVPLTPSAALARMKELCATRPAGYLCLAKTDAPFDESSAGTAPWRIAQLYRMTVDSLRASKTGDRIASAAIDRAFVTAGIMSHFVGDLGNPYHATANYDGWESGQGGIHSYFEGAMVAGYRLTLEQEVLDAALAGRGFERALQQIPPDRSNLARDPRAISVALALDSHTRLEAANAIDKAFAILKPSGVGPEGKRISAERRDASELRVKYHDLIVERLATAAETLANLWLMAWEDAGKPDFKGYQSFAYAIAPEFIPPDYLSTKR